MKANIFINRIWVTIILKMMVGLLCAPCLAAETNVLKIGDDESRVVSVLGSPKGVVEFNNIKECYYKNGSVTLKNGRIVGMQLDARQQLADKQKPHGSTQAGSPPLKNESLNIRPKSIADAPPPDLSPQSADRATQAIRERRYQSAHPLYFRMVFGANGNSSMLGVIDESRGADSGYDVAYVDENMNGDLTDDAAKQFPAINLGKLAGTLEAQLDFKGPFKGGGSARYVLNLYPLPDKTHRSVCTVQWQLDTEGWHYMFINGRLKLFPSSAEALKGEPVRLAGDCKWEIKSYVQDGKTMVSAGLKDNNGCTLRVVSGPNNNLNKKLLPMLTLLQDGAIKKQDKMEFG